MATLFRSSVVGLLCLISLCSIAAWRRDSGARASKTERVVELALQAEYAKDAAVRRSLSGDLAYFLAVQGAEDRIAALAGVAESEKAKDFVNSLSNQVVGIGLCREFQIHADIETLRANKPCGSDEPAITAMDMKTIEVIRQGG